MYMRERIVTGTVSDLPHHAGPTMILVKTAAFTTTRYARPTSTARSGYDSDDDDDDGPNLSAGAIAGIVIGSIVGFLLLLVCCCKGCCGSCARKTARPARPIMTSAERKNIMERATELMQQGGGKESVERRRYSSLLDPLANGPARTGDVDGIGRAEEARAGDVRRVEEARVGDVVNPPPKYTP